MSLGQQPWQVRSAQPAWVRGRTGGLALRGSLPRSALEPAVGAQSGSGDWNAAFTVVLESFSRVQWPRCLLSGSAQGAGRGAAGNPGGGR